MAVNNDLQQNSVPIVPRFTSSFEALRAKYQDIVKNALFNQEEFPNYCIALRAIFNNDMNSLRSVIDPIEDGEVDDEINYYVNDDTCKMDLTPLHVAVMTGHLVAAQMLLNTGKCEVNKEDSHGATAAHHAAVLGHQEVVALLENHGADFSTTDAYGGKVSDLLGIIHNPINQLTQQFFFQMPNGEIIEKTGIEFYERTRAVLLDSDLILSPFVWLENWKNSETTVKPKDFENALRAQYFDFKCKPPPKVLVRHDSVVGYYLRAGQEIKQFSIIGEYLGKIDTDEWKKKEKANEDRFKERAMGIDSKEERQFVFSDNPSVDYNLEGIDAYAFRGLMGLVSDSFPNIIVYPVMSAYGVSRRILFIAATDIREGEVFACDYGKDHQVKRMPFKELRQEALDNFFTNYHEVTLLKMMREFSNSPRNLNEKLAILSFQSRLEYLLHSPTAMVSLYLKEIVMVETLRKLFNASKQEVGNVSGFPTFLSKTKSMQEHFLIALRTFHCQCQQKKDTPLVEKAKAQLQGMLESASTLDIYRFLINPFPVAI